ncbi:transposable element Tcb2 transposase [Trichonephila clavipes]|nr:transposable element Tcb2 transposase [Trichonephila clavipes]
MDDNAPCHRTVAAEQLLESEDIERMDWTARSPDLNPIEHVWDFLGRRLAARTLPSVTIRELRLALQDEWAAMPQQLIDTLILSMGRRCETCLAVRRSHPLLKTGCFLLDTYHGDVSGLQSHCAPCYFFNQASFIPLISLLVSVAYIIHVLTYWGSLYGSVSQTSLVYADKPQTLNHLEDNIRRVIADIRPQMLEKVIENSTSRLDYIRASRGSPMPEIIFKM